MNKEIEMIVANALLKLPDNLVRICAEKKYFVTQVINPKDIPYMIDGEVRNPQPHVIIDCETVQIFDKEKFLQHSVKLYNNLFSIKDWYKC